MIKLVKYLPSDKTAWDDFLNNSKVDTFLFKRDFMDYHCDRFVDCSFMIYRKGKLEAVLPGNISGKIYYSHQGLTFGGIVSSTKLTVNDVLDIFKELNNILKIQGVEEVVYKLAPHIYHKFPSDEDSYALFRLGAQRIASNISSVIFQNMRIPFVELRKRGIKKANKNKITVSCSSDYNRFWEILTNNLAEKYGRKPVHTLSEISSLVERFPDNIKLYGAYHGELLLAGVVLFVTNLIVHVQYISANDAGKDLGALDIIFDKLINEDYIECPVFDFGQSTEQNGFYLNEGLIFQKEGFGGRGVVYETYKYEI